MIPRIFIVGAALALAFLVGPVESSAIILPVQSGTYEIKCDPCECKCFEVHLPSGPYKTIWGDFKVMTPDPPNVTCTPPSWVSMNNAWIWETQSAGFGFVNLSTPSCFNESARECVVTVTSGTSQFSSYSSWRSALGLP